MIAVTADHLRPDHPGGWVFEPKFDGFRCTAFHAGFPDAMRCG
jgi:ATP-dependent DNA ligase